ncbi:MAG: hypothetical protein ABH868_04600 [bacterium]
MVKVDQDHVHVVIFIQNFIIEGTIHTLMKERLSDFLNVSRKFIPVTSASIYKLPEKELVDKVKFMDINKDYITAIFPRDERGEDTSENEE